MPKFRRKAKHIVQNKNLEFYLRLVNTDLKTLSKALAAKLKSNLLSLITSQQIGLAQNRYIGETGKLIFDVLYISEKLRIYGYLVTIDGKKSLPLY